MAYTDEKPKGSKYPTQCWVAQNATQTLSLENELRIPEPDSNYSPYTMHGTFSRFRLSLILPPQATDGKRRVIFYNIRHTDEIAYIFDQYEEAKYYRRVFLQENSVEKVNRNSPAYTVVFGLGNKLKGKTAAEFLLDGGSTEELQKSANFLAQKLKEWPANQDYIDAIDDALYLHSIGALSKEKAVASSFVLLNEQNKIRGDDKRGLKITCMFGYDYPWQFDFTNCKINQEGKTIPNSVITGSYALNDAQMSGLILAMKQTLLAHQITMYPAAKTMARAMEAEIYGEKSFDPATHMIEDLIESIKPSLIESIKAIICRQ